MKWAVALLIGFGIITVGFRFAGWLLTGFFYFELSGADHRGAAAER
jgi:hypothetical protein